MEIRSVEGFLEYFSGIRKRTERIVGCIPPERIEWTYREGKFTLGDLVRHLGATERWMFAENVSGRPSRYAGCSTELASGYDGVVAYLGRMHEESMALFGALDDADLERKCKAPARVRVAGRRVVPDHVTHVLAVDDQQGHRGAGLLVDEAPLHDLVRLQEHAGRFLRRLVGPDPALIDDVRERLDRAFHAVEVDLGASDTRARDAAGGRDQRDQQRRRDGRRREASQPTAFELIQMLAHGVQLVDGGAGAQKETGRLLDLFEGDALGRKGHERRTAAGDQHQQGVLSTE